jgi:hypothetical protein
MKQILIVCSLLLSGTFAHAESKWTCYRYVDGKPTGGTVSVYASSKEEAARKALEKYKKLGYRIDSVDCK